MPAPIEDTTSQLIERARTELLREQRSAQTDSQGAKIIFVVANFLLGGYAMAGVSSLKDGKAGHVAFVVGIAIAAFLGLFAYMMFRVQLARTANHRVERMRWLETQARDGLLSDAEIRRELLRLLR